MARGTSPSGGKDCNLHFGRPERGVISPISMLGALIPVMAGIALAGVRYDKWIRFMLPLMAILAVASLVMLGIAAALE